MKRNKYCKCGSKFCESCSGKKLITKGYREEIASLNQGHMKKRAFNNYSDIELLKKFKPTIKEN